MEINERKALEERARRIRGLCRDVPVCKGCPLDMTNHCDTAISKMTDEQLLNMIALWNERSPYKQV